MQQALSPFKKRVLEIVQVIPKGKVMSYGQIALYAGFPRASRQVGQVLRDHGEVEGVAWWRVVNQKGAISIKGNLTADRDLQKKLLEAEGVEVNDFQVDMGRYRFIATERQLKKFQLDEVYIEKTVLTYHL